jgi:hypothetical protein
MLKWVPVVIFLCFFRHPGADDVRKPVSLFNGIDLTHWQVTEFGTGGGVSVKDSALILNMGDGATGVTWAGDMVFPTQDYEVNLKASRLDGNDFFCGLTFPINDRHLTLIVGGWGGSLVGLSCLDGQDASENETMQIKSFVRNRWYAIRVRVQNNTVEVWIDDESIIRVDVSERELSLRPEVLLSRPFGIATWYTKAAIKDITLTRLK